MFHVSMLLLEDHQSALLPREALCHVLLHGDLVRFGQRVVHVDSKCLFLLGQEDRMLQRLLVRVLLLTDNHSSNRHDRIHLLLLYHNTGLLHFRFNDYLLLLLHHYHRILLILHHYHRILLLLHHYHRLLFLYHCRWGDHDGSILRDVWCEVGQIGDALLDPLLRLVQLGDGGRAAAARQTTADLVEVFVVIVVRWNEYLAGKQRPVVHRPLLGLLLRARGVLVSGEEVHCLGVVEPLV